MGWSGEAEPSRKQVHDTHHPLDITDFYEAQKDVAIVRSRVFRDLRAPKFLGGFEATLPSLEDTSLPRMDPPMPIWLYSMFTTE